MDLADTSHSRLKVADCSFTPEWRQLLLPDWCTHSNRQTIVMNGCSIHTCTSVETDLADELP